MFKAIFKYLGFVEGLDFLIKALSFYKSLIFLVKQWRLMVMLFFFVVDSLFFQGFVDFFDFPFKGLFIGFLKGLLKAL